MECVIRGVWLDATICELMRQLQVSMLRACIQVCNYVHMCVCMFVHMCVCVSACCVLVYVCCVCIHVRTQCNCVCL